MPSLAGRSRPHAELLRRTSRGLIPIDHNGINLSPLLALDQAGEGLPLILTKSLNISNIINHRDKVRKFPDQPLHYPHKKAQLFLGDLVQ